MCPSVPTGVNVCIVVVYVCVLKRMSVKVKSFLPELGTLHFSKNMKITVTGYSFSYIGQS